MPSDCTILVVEDNVDTSRIIDMILESEGYRVICAKNGEHAKEIMGAETPDCIVLDIMMPEMDGFTFCSWVRSQKTFRDIPVILLTSFSKHIYESKHSHKEALYTEADEYLEKPVKPERLLAILEDLLKKRER
ncbi:MAG: response regulator [Spirochaetes bacterium]|nr:response regulator [Spirochaetota bacterium]